MEDIQEKFINQCKEIIMEHNPARLSKDEIYVVWSCKTLQNSKALLGTKVSDGMYYECTLNGDKQEIYFDAYKKQLNKAIPFK